MPEKFKYILIFIILNLFNIFTQDKPNYISIIKSFPVPLTDSAVVTSEYILNMFEIKLLDNNKVNLINLNDILTDELKGSYDEFYFKKLVNIIFAKGINAFFLIGITEINSELIFDIKLYNSIGDLKLNKKLVLKSNLKDNKLDYEVEQELQTLINEFIDNLKEIKTKKIKDINLNLKKFKLIHDYPLLSFGVSALSTKIYFDDRMPSFYQKIFSFSPIDIRLTFFPLRYFEIGLMGKFDINNMVFRYKEENDKIKYFESFFLFDYGFFLGFSLFFESAHYSFGLQVYNTHYDITHHKEWQKLNEFNCLFIPQFAFYQKIDFKIFKILYFSLIFNLKTNPMFYLKNNYFYSRSFNYDFITFEVIFVGLTLII